MKNHFLPEILMALAVAVGVAGCTSTSSAQSFPTSADASALPAGITPGTPAAEVLKLAQADIDAGIIQSYISGCPDAFNLDADQIIALTDAGVSSDLINAMMAHDKNLAAADVSQPATPAPAPVDDTVSAPPATDMTVEDFNNTLAPYGQWIAVDGYGRCWRPTVVVYDSSWQPYCDRGRWVYTDCGWYWDSNYAWGATFHYGRWFNSPRYGWCWWPDTVWAPSWVTWRSGGDYCGWAPLPPFTAYRPGAGFFYRGANVTLGFNFGLSANCFTFVSARHFCDPNPRDYCVPHREATRIFSQSTVINNYHYNRDHRAIVNDGVSVTFIGSAAHRSIRPVSVSTFRHAGYHGWQNDRVNQNNGFQTGPRGSPARPDAGRTEIYNRAAGNPSGSHGTPDAGRIEIYNRASGNQSAPDAGRIEIYNRAAGARVGAENGAEHKSYQRWNNGYRAGHRPPFTPAQPVNRSGAAAPSGHPQNSGTPPNQQNQHQPGWSGYNHNNARARNFNAFAVERPGNNWPARNDERFSPRSALREEPRQFNSPVVGERPQHFELRPNRAESAPRNTVTAAPPVSSQRASPAGGGKFQGWAVQNH
jgi:hypothetical protein